MVASRTMKVWAIINERKSLFFDRSQTTHLTNTAHLVLPFKLTKH